MFNIRRKFLMSLALLLFAAASFVTTTFAWISIAQEAAVGNLNLGVIPEYRLEISIDGKNYSESISKTELQNLFKKNIALRNTTTYDLENFYSSHEETDIAIANKDYITFTLWFRTDDDLTHNLYLTNNVSSKYTYDELNDNITGTYVISQGVNFTTPITYQYGPNQTMEKNTTAIYFASNAVRIGIKELNADSAYLETADQRSNLTTLIYDPSENEERGFGKAYGAFDYYNKRVSTPATLPKISPATKYSLSTFQYNYYAVNNDSLCATFQKGIENGKVYYYAKIQVYIWLEGWDADCMDAIYNDNIAIQLAFRTAVAADVNN